MPYRKRLAFMLCLVLGLVEGATAAPGDKVLIHADYMKFDMTTGDSVYRGNVSFVQGRIELSGDVITVGSKDGEITRVRVDGNPARYNNTNENGRVLAESEHMDYVVADNRLNMQGSARLEQDDRVVQSQHIIYDTEKQLIIAGKSSGEKVEPGERVNITLTPRKEKDRNP